MEKYNESIYNKDTVEEAQNITLLERLLLLFIPKTRVEDEDTISHFKKLFGKFYLIDFKIKDL